MKDERVPGAHDVLRRHWVFPADGRDLGNSVGAGNARIAGAALALCHRTVIPAQAGIQGPLAAEADAAWQCASCCG